MPIENVNDEEAPFTNRELRQFFAGFQKTLDRVEKSVDERVKPLEDELAKMLQWRAGLLGKITIIGIVLAGLWGLAVAAITKKFF